MKSTLGLRQIPASFSGWSARARYDGPGGTATTNRATITVRSNPYDSVIETYRTVHRSGTGNIENHISELVNSYDFLGYVMLDLDGNGVEELILASNGSNMYPNVIYEVYTIKNGNAVCVTQSRARERYFMLQDGRFLMEDSSGARNSSWITYRFTGESLSIDEQICTSEQPRDMADFAPYYYYKGSIYGQSEPVVYDEAMRTIENWKSAVPALTLTPVS